MDIRDLFPVVADQAEAFRLQTTVRDLAEAVKTVSPCLNKWSREPSFRCVLFAGGRAVAFDGDRCISVDIANFEFTGSALIDGRTLTAALKGWRGEQEVTLSRAAGAVGARVDVRGFSARIAGLEVDKFCFPSGSAPEFSPIDGDKLASALSRIAPFISNEETRYYLNGVYFDFSDAALVATNGHYLRIINGVIGEQFRSGILPTMACNLISGFPSVSEFSFADSLAVFRSAGMVSVCRLIDGSYPDYARVVDPVRENDLEIEFAPLELKAALRRQIAFSESYHKYVRLSFEPGFAILSQSDGEAGKVSEVVRVDTPAPSDLPAFTVNAGYLATCARDMQAGEKVLLGRHGFGGQPPKPMLFVKRDGLVVLMPARGEDPDDELQALQRDALRSLKVQRKRGVPA